MKLNYLGPFGEFKSTWIGLKLEGGIQATFYYIM